MSSSTGNSVGSAPSAPSKPPRANLSNAVPEHVSLSLAQQQDIGQVKEVGQLLSKQSCRRSSTVGRGSASPSVTSRYSSAENLNEMKKVGLLLSRQSSRRSSAGGRASAPSSVSSRNSSAETLNADQDNTSSSLAQLKEPRQMKEVGKLLSRQSSRRSSAGGRALAPSSISSRCSSAETLNAAQHSISSSPAQLEEPGQMKEVGQLLSRQSSRRLSVGGRASAPSSVSSRYSSAEALNAHKLEEPRQKKKSSLSSSISSSSRVPGSQPLLSRQSSKRSIAGSSGLTPSVILSRHSISNSSTNLQGKVEDTQFKSSDTINETMGKSQSKRKPIAKRNSFRNSVSRFQSLFHKKSCGERLEEHDCLVV